MNVYDLLAQSAERWADRPALVFAGQTITFSQLRDEVDRLAAGLDSLGLQRGDRVLVHAQNRPEILTTYFAAGKLGGVLVPVNPALRPEEIRYVMDHAEPALAVVDARAATSLAAAVAAGAWRPPVIVSMDHSLPAGLTASAGYAELLATGRPSPSTAAGGADNMLIVYTSGSTGRPKGVVASHTNEVDSAIAYADVWKITPADVVVVSLPLAFLYGLTTAAVTALGAGATVWLERRFHPGETLAALEQAPRAVFHGVPTMFQMMLAYAEEQNKHFDLKNLRLCLSAGAPLHDAVRHRFSTRFGVEIMDFYALTEIRPVFAYDYARYRSRRPGSCGHRLPGVDVAIVDEQGQPVPRGEPGELICRSSTLMKAYHKDPVTTAQAVRNGWFYTGDLFREDEDGFFYVVGRKKDLIIRGGINVAPAEVEAVLLRHPAVAEAAVVGIPDRVYGEAICAFIRRQPDTAVSVDDLRAFCREHLAEYKVPDRIEALDEFPKSPNGKVQRSALIERAKAAHQ